MHLLVGCDTLANEATPNVLPAPAVRMLHILMRTLEVFARYMVFAVYLS